MRKPILLLVSMAVAMAIVVAGCSDTPDQDVARKKAKEKPKTVVVKEKPKTVSVNKGMSKKEEKKLNERLDELEKKVDSQDENGSQENASQPTESSQSEQPQAPQAEDQAQAAAAAYYQAVEAQEWGYTYDHLDSETQSAFTRDEWFAKNQGGADASPATFTVQYVGMDDSSPSTLANVTVLVTGEDGSSSVRNTYFVYEDGIWKHRFGPEEYEILANAPSTTASASASASATATSSPSASPNPSPNRNYNAPNPSHMSTADCISEGGHPVPAGTDGDGDGDGCAGE